MSGSIQHSVRFVFVAAFALTIPSLPAFAADAARGQQYAQRVCSLCHAVLSNQAVSPNPDAPPFRVVAKGKNFRKKGAAWLWERHPKMPNLAFTPDEAADVAAYIRTLRK